MSMTETIRPTLTAEDTDGGGYVLDGAFAFDQNATTFSRVIAELSGQHSTQILSGFGADSDPGNRTSVVIELDLARFGWTAGDRAFVFFRPTAVAPWANVAGYDFADLGTVSALKTIDVTAAAASNPSTGFELAVQFENDTVGDPEVPGRL